MSDLPDVQEVTQAGDGEDAEDDGTGELVRKLFFTGLPAPLLAEVSPAFEIIEANITRFGSGPAAIGPA